MARRPPECDKITVVKYGLLQDEFESAPDDLDDEQRSSSGQFNRAADVSNHI